MILDCALWTYSHLRIFQNKMNKLTFILSSIIAITFLACKGGSQDNTERKEDLQAKKLLQGIWIDPDDEDVVFKIKGDTIYYPDSLSQPIKFAVYGDTLEMQSSTGSKYAILKQSAHIFEFKNPNGDIIKLVKGSDPSYETQFDNKKPTPINQNKVLKNDSVVFCGQDRYHSYVQVNPTTYKVLKTSYSDDGLEVENVYFDNTIHVGIYKQAEKIFSKDFYKKDFSKFVPSDFLRQSVLSDIILNNSDSKYLHYQAQLIIPDSYLSYIVNIDISTDGKMSMSIQK